MGTAVLTGFGVTGAAAATMTTEPAQHPKLLGFSPVAKSLADVVSICGLHRQRAVCPGRSYFRQRACLQE